MSNSSPCGGGPFLGSRAVSAGLLTKGQLRGPNWRRLFRDVHIRSDVPLDHQLWCEAALLSALPGAVIGFRSALGFYCPMLMPADAPVDLVVPRSVNLRPDPRRRVHRVLLDQSEIRTWWGLPVTAPARTAFDLVRCRDVDLVEATVCVDALLGRRVTTVAEIAAYARRPGPGRARLRRTLALASPRSESPMETRTRLLLVLAGLPAPAVQFEVYDDTGFFVARLDLAYPELRIGIEYDGDHHRGRGVFRRDAVRANQLWLCNWTVLRFTADDILRHPDRVVSQVRALLASRKPGSVEVQSTPVLSDWPFDSTGVD